MRVLTTSCACNRSLCVTHDRVDVEVCAQARVASGVLKEDLVRVKAQCLLEKALVCLWTARLEPLQQRQEPFYQLPVYVSVTVPNGGGGAGVGTEGEGVTRAYYPGEEVFPSPPRHIRLSNTEHNLFNELR
jgi:hypothetical protein